MSGFTYKLYESTSNLARTVKNIVTFPKNIIGISRIVNKPSYYPDMERKTRAEMWKDNFIWLCKNKELNRFYTSYGLDVKGLYNPDDFIPHQEFCVMRDAGNQKQKHTITGHYSYIVLLRDKYIFSAYLASTIGSQCVVPSIALISNGRAFLTEKNQWTEISELLTDNSELVYKVSDGECADGVMLVQVKNNTVCVDGKEFKKQDFIESLYGKNIIVQNVVIQHPDLRAFQTRSVNTIRIVTVKGKSGAVNVFAAFLRLSASSESFVDNRAKGGIGIGVNLESGQLMKYGFPHDQFGVKLEEHPLSGIRFEGYQIPYWNETVELVRNAHKQFYELQSIGWDVVLTEEGPVLLEGNDDWEIGGPQDTYGGLKKRWNDLTNG